MAQQKGMKRAVKVAQRKRRTVAAQRKANLKRVASGHVAQPRTQEEHVHGENCNHETDK